MDNSKFERSSSYRQILIKEKRPYICAYCGRKFKSYKSLEADHIIPIAKVKAHKGYFIKKYLNRHNYNGINDPKNLTWACHFCNSRKRARINLWYLILGHNTNLWTPLHILQVIFFIFITYFLCIKNIVYVWNRHVPQFNTNTNLYYTLTHFVNIKSLFIDIFTNAGNILYIAILLFVFIDLLIKKLSDRKYK